MTPAGEPVQRFVEAQGIPSTWWQFFHSATMDATETEALAANQSIAASEANLAQARQTVRQVEGSYWPQVDFAASAQRQRGPASSLGLSPGRDLPTYNLYSVGAIASFSPDVFGLTARRTEQQQALADMQGDQLAAVRLAVTGNVVLQAFTAASLREQIDAVQAIVADDQKTVSIVNEKVAVGRAAQVDRLTAEAQLASDQSLLPPLRQQLAVAEDALAILVGKSPAEWHAPTFRLDDFTLPSDLPLTLPSTLVRQRPDILAAEAQLHASSAAIGVATAQMYPSFPLSATVDTAALSTTSLFERSSLVWTLAGGLSAPLFHGGALKAQKQGAIEGFHAALAVYRQTVLQAFGQVADILRALGHDAEWAGTERRSLDTASTALDLQRLAYQTGRIDLLRLLDAQRTYQQARLGYARARAQRYLDSAQLLVAMGGGQAQIAAWEQPPQTGSADTGRSPGTSPFRAQPGAD